MHIHDDSRASSEADQRSHPLVLFAYGSLRPGECNFGQLEDHFLEAVPWRVPGHLRLRPEGYPALVLAPQLPQALGRPYDWDWPPLLASETAGGHESWVRGDLIRLRNSREIRERLDDFEGFSGARFDYLRVAVRCNAELMWTYVAPRDVPEWPRIDSWPLAEPPPLAWSERGTMRCSDSETQP